MAVSRGRRVVSLQLESDRSPGLQYAGQFN